MHIYIIYIIIYIYTLTPLYFSLLRRSILSNWNSWNYIGKESKQKIKNLLKIRGPDISPSAKPVGEIPPVCAFQAPAKPGKPWASSTNWTHKKMRNELFGTPPPCHLLFLTQHANCNGTLPPATALQRHIPRAMKWAQEIKGREFDGMQNCNGTLPRAISCKGTSPVPSNELQQKLETKSTACKLHRHSHRCK